MRLFSLDRAAKSEAKHLTRLGTFLGRVLVPDQRASRSMYQLLVMKAFRIAAAASWRTGSTRREIAGVDAVCLETQETMDHFLFRAAGHGHAVVTELSSVGDSFLAERVAASHNDQRRWQDREIVVRRSEG